MFRELRRIKQLLSTEDSEVVLNDADTGVLAVLGDEDYPYAVPVNYVYEDNKIYFHCAKQGHKIDAIQKHDKVSFTVIAEDTVVPETFSTNFKSVIAFGRASIIEDEQAKLSAIRLINQKYAPNHMESGEEEIKKYQNAFYIVQIEIEHLSGKQAKAMVNHS